MCCGVVVLVLCLRCAVAVLALCWPCAGAVLWHCAIVAPAAFSSTNVRGWSAGSELQRTFITSTLSLVRRSGDTLSRLQYCICKHKRLLCALRLQQ